MATVTIGKTGGFISGETVTPEKLNELGVPTVALANDEVTTNKILNSAVTADKLATGAVTGAAGGGKLAASSITGQTTIADALADGDEFLVHDASASALRKVAYSSIAPTVTAAKLDGVAKNNSGGNLSAGTAPMFGCRAWVNFDATRDTTNTASSLNTNRLLRAAGNVSSVTRTATGKYTINFSPALPDANYCVLITTCGDNVNDMTRAGVVRGAAASGADLKTTTQLAIVTGATSTGAAADLAEVNVIIIR